MIEIITIENVSEQVVDVTWNEVRYACRPHARIEIPGNILYKFTVDDRCVRVRSRMGELADLEVKPPAQGERVLCDNEQAIPYKPIEFFDEPVIKKTTEKKAREMAREDAAAINTGNKPKRTRTAKKKPRGRPRKNASK